MTVGALSFLLMIGVKEKLHRQIAETEVKTEIKNLSLMLVQALPGINLEMRQDFTERIQEDSGHSAPKSNPSFEQG